MTKETKEDTTSVERKYLKSGDVDREKTCPLLLRVFYRLGGHHRVENFDKRIKVLSTEEVQIYTWKDATLRELTDLVKEIHNGARGRNAKLSFALIYPDKSGRMVLREVGQVWSQPKRGDQKDDMKTLDELHFETGDYLSVAIYVNG